MTRTGAFFLATLLCLSSLSSCASHVSPQGGSRPLFADDRALSLPGAQKYLSYTAPYAFQTQGVQKLEDACIRLGQSGDAVASLLLARMAVDALLFAEIAQSEKLLDALDSIPGKCGSSDGFWDWVGVLLQETDGPEEVERAAAEGRALLQALRTRGMDRAYHGALQEIIAARSFWTPEARVARVLDLDEALEGVKSLPFEERLDAFTGALGGSVCKGGEVPEEKSARRDQCSLSCEGAVEMDAIPWERRDAVFLATCGFEKLGWPSAPEFSIYHPEYALVARIFSQTGEDLLELVTRTGNPLGLSLRGELDLLQQRLGEGGVPGLWRAENAADGPIHLVTVKGGLSELPPVPVFLTLDGELLRVSVLPILGMDGVRGMRLMEYPWSYPGEVALSWRGREVVANHWDGLPGTWDDAWAWLERRSVAEEATRHVVLYPHRDVNADRLWDAVSRVKGLGAGREGTRVHLAAWSGSSGQAEGFVVGFAPLQEDDLWREVPFQARPEVMDVRVDREALMVAWKGKPVAKIPHVGGKVDTEALRGEIARLRRVFSMGREATFVRPDKRMSTEGFFALMEVFAQEGFSEIWWRV